MNSKIYPFKFLDAYSREDKAIFFGRGEEIKALYEMIFQTDLVVIYGASGTGKTSLVQCGLANRFQTHDWLPIRVLRGSDWNASLERALDAHLGLEDLEHDLPESEDNNTAIAQSPLARKFKAIYLAHFRPIYLIFDQFEELYVLGTEGERAIFVKTVCQILRLEQSIKILIIIREEYLGHLYEFEKAVPDLLRKKLRVEAMNLEKVKTVMQGFATLKQSRVTILESERAVLAERVFEKIKGRAKRVTIQLPYLQVFLDKFYLHLSQDESRQAEVQLSLAGLSSLGDFEDLLRDFLEEQVRKVQQDLGVQETVLWKVLSEFVTLEGTKQPFALSAFRAAQCAMSLAELTAVLQSLVARRILRFNEHGEVYEVAHDSLARQIHEKRSDEDIAILEVQRLIKSQMLLKPEVRGHLTENQLQFITPYEAKIMLSGEEKAWIEESRAVRAAEKGDLERRNAAELARSKRYTRIAIGTAVVMLLLLVAAMGAYYRAEVQTEKALSEWKKSLKSDIQRLENEIHHANSNIDLYKGNDAGADLFEYEAHKRDSLQQQQQVFQQKLNHLEK